MIRTKILLAAAAAACTALLTAPSAPPAPPLPGPGKVIHAVRGFLSAVDRGDQEEVARWLSTGGPGATYGFDANDDELRQLPDPGATAVDVSHRSGASFHRKGSDVAAALIEQLGADRLETRILAIRADCRSERASFAVLDFDRVYPGGEGEKPTVVPMRATALLQHQERGFTLYHWHASRRESAGD